MSVNVLSQPKRGRQTEDGDIGEDQPHPKVRCKSPHKTEQVASVPGCFGDGEAISSIANQFLALEQKLSCDLNALHFSQPVTHVYNPLEYAAEPHVAYVRMYCQSTKDVLFLGMNPGPYGMAQTGVPFGEVSVVKEWLQISGHVEKPINEHPRKLVSGFDCKRKEVSGDRFWGLFRRLCGTPDVFFRRCFVHNLCPLLFLGASGKNLTPPDLRASERNAANEICERVLCDVTRLLRVRTIVGIGKFAQKRAQVALRNGGINDVKVETMLHPSPASPAANKGWDAVAERQLTDLGVMQSLTAQT